MNVGTDDLVVANMPHVEATQRRPPELSVGTGVVGIEKDESYLPHHDHDSVQGMFGGMEEPEGDHGRIVFQLPDDLCDLFHVVPIREGTPLELGQEVAGVLGDPDDHGALTPIQGHRRPVQSLLASPATEPRHHIGPTGVPRRPHRCGPNPRWSLLTLPRVPVRARDTAPAGTTAAAR